MTSSGGGVAGHRADAVLSLPEPASEEEKRRAEEEQRSAQVTLADIATVITGWTEEAQAAGLWDEEAAKAMTREALEAAGFIDYQPAQGRRHFGQVREP